MLLNLALLCLLAPAPTAVTWSLVDVAAGRTYTIPDDPARLTDGGMLIAEPDDAGLRFLAVHRPPAVTVTVTDTRGQERGLVVRLALELPAEPGHWWQDPDTLAELTARPQDNTAGLRDLPGLPEFGESSRPDYGRYSVYPAGAVQFADGWLALGRLREQLVLTRFQASGGERPRLVAEADLGLSPNSRTPGAATFSLLTLRGDGARGLRAALAEVLDLPNQAVRATRFGGWMPFADLARIDDVDEFGFAYQEGAPNAAYDDALGVDSFVYFHCAGEFVKIPGYQRGSEPLPPYETIVAAFNRIAEQHSGVPDVWDVCGVRGPDGRIDFRPEKTYGDFFCQACVDPDLPYGRAMADRLLARVKETAAPVGIDGVYYDGVATGLDYAPAHLATADHPLLWDGQRGRVVNYNLFSSAAWAKYIHDSLAGTGKLTMLNDSSLSSFAFLAPWIDVPGAEMGLTLRREQALLIRATVGRKPFCTLVKADFDQVDPARIETYLRRCVAYGILFGFFDISPSGDNPGSSYWVHPEWYDRDRPLFRRYLPLARELAAAGWQPDPLASADGAQVERFGPAEDLTYLTVSTDPRDDNAPRTVTVRLEPELGAAGLAVELLTGRIEPVGETLTMALSGDDLAVWAIGPAAAQQAAVARREMDQATALLGYLRANQLGAQVLTPWVPYGAGGASIVPGGRESDHALRLERTEIGQPAGAQQVVRLNQTAAAPLLVSGWCRPLGVSGEPGSDFSLYLDCYYSDGTALYGQTLEWPTGTGEWAWRSGRIEPDKPIQTIQVYLLMRGRQTGVALVDDLQLTAVDEPAKNLLGRGGFEPRAMRPAPDPLPATPAEVLALWDRAAADGLAATAEAGRAWGGAERMARDLEQHGWHRALAARIAAGGAQPARRESRLLAFAALGANRPADRAPRQFVATAGSLPAGTVVTVDSSYSGYRPEPLADGRINPPEAGWAEQAWASGEGGDHWIELQFPEPRPIEAVTVCFARDGGQPMVSRQVVLELWQDGRWVAGAAPQPGEERVMFPVGATVARLRVRQPAGGGSVDRPELLWVTELMVR